MDNANQDGGWGDTEISKSNISTTALTWAALNFAAPDDARQNSVTKAEQWIAHHAGSAAPQHITEAILKKYGKDRTFSVPILMMCALCGRMGEGREAWRNVLPLPFELTLFPRSWFAALRLPVVSYALPALIAIGQACHHHNPTRNPIARRFREIARQPSLKLLNEIQPASGGFLEATPLTSFVAMSLGSFLEQPHPVIDRALGFLLQSQRPDGSWPIDTHLATWVSTLSINGFAQGDGLTQCFQRDEGQQMLDWLLRQQYRERHPYTDAAPGGWAWTPLSGGVPDTDDTSGGLMALLHLCEHPEDHRDAAEHAASWLFGLQNSDGGMPTFCRGWGALPFDQSCPDITAHALRALHAWRNHFSDEVQRKLARFTRKAIRYLDRHQQPEGCWAPLWFGNEHEPNLVNWTYGTAQVLTALLETSLPQEQAQQKGLRKGAQWLLQAQQEDGSWGGGKNIQPSIEETALATLALVRSAMASQHFDDCFREDCKQAAFRGANWIIESTGGCRRFEPSPIGFYFAELWYYEQMYPLVYSLAAFEALCTMEDG